MRVYGSVNLASLRHNLTIVRQHAPSSLVMAVVKKDAYGHGLIRVAKAIDDQADGFAVASVDEGVALRESGILSPICVLSGFYSKEHIDELIKNALEPVIHCQEQLEILQSGSQQPTIWVKFDSGMNRLGFRLREYAQTMASIHRIPSLRIKGIMTHFACADELTSDFTDLQIKWFNESTQTWSGAKSLANSAAILRWPKSQSDWVRPGLMLYGASPFTDISAQQLGLKPVMELYSVILAIKTVQPGDGVGYGLTWKSPRQQRIAIVAAGYGDGYHRFSSGKADVLIGGRRARLIGRISMDMLAVDLDGVSHAEVGMPVKLFGEQLPVENLAAASATVPYEVFTSLNPHTVSLTDV